MKILVIGPSWVGDMVMSHSLYQALSARYPDAQIDVMAPDWCRPLLERMPEVNQALRMPLGHGEFKLSTRWRLGRLLKGRYDHAFILPNSLKSALVPFFAGISKRTGWKGESRYGLLNDLRANKHDFTRMVDRYVALAYPKEQMRSERDLPNLPKPYLRVTRTAQLEALHTLQLTEQRPILALCPGAEFGPAKRWPEAQYASVAAFWIEQRQGQVWIFGSAKDQPVGEQIRSKLAPAQQSHCHLLTGQTSLGQAIELMSLSSAVVCNDSGLMHIAAALNRPIVAVYGSTSTQYTPPLSDQVAVLHTNIGCRPCFKRTCPLGHLKCLTELPASDAINALDNLLPTLLEVQEA
ncbi:lipopolysaccharide heptosyltransferase II [Celerinatantimonas yamalensis]|uniref:lipopolysaccharide heptosyltransferase II n=1 Tax=Celerinatantimonas yamalensis TaxID=559956 RepID=A0ABW9GB63_9GAMM